MLKKRSTSTAPTKSLASADEAAPEKAAVVGFDVVPATDGHPRAVCWGLLEEASASKQRVKVATAPFTVPAERCASVSCARNAGVTADAAGAAPPVRSPKNTTPTTATPMAPPSCWKVVSTPEAEPAWRGGTPARTMLSSGATTVPMPRPVTRKLGMSSHPVSPVPAACRVSMMAPIPTTIMEAPAVMVHLPNRGADAGST